MRWSWSKLVHGSSPLSTRFMEGMYSSRQALARLPQSALPALSAPRRRASAATPERQSTVVPKTSKVRARTPPRRGSALEGGIVFGKITLDYREIKGGED